MVQIVGSVRRLLLDVATLGFLVAIISVFPGQSLRIALPVGIFVPTVAVCALFGCVCENRSRALLVCVGGAFLGWLLSPTMYAIHEDPTRYDWYFDNILCWGILPPISAAVAGLAVWMIEFCRRRAISRGHANETSTEATKCDDD
jgi:hypothetical protein